MGHLVAACDSRNTSFRRMRLLPHAVFLYKTCIKNSKNRSHQKAAHTADKRRPYRWPPSLVINAMRLDVLRDGLPDRLGQRHAQTRRDPLQLLSIQRLQPQCDNRRSLHTLTSRQTSYHICITPVKPPAERCRGHIRGWFLDRCRGGISERCRADVEVGGSSAGGSKPLGGGPALFGAGP